MWKELRRRDAENAELISARLLCALCVSAFQNRSQQDHRTYLRSHARSIRLSRGSGGQNEQVRKIKRGDAENAELLSAHLLCALCEIRSEWAFPQLFAIDRLVRPSRGSLVTTASAFGHGPKSTKKPDAMHLNPVGSSLLIDSQPVHGVADERSQRSLPVRLAPVTRRLREANRDGGSGTLLLPMIRVGRATWLQRCLCRLLLVRQPMLASHRW